MKNVILIQSKPGIGKTTLAKSVAEELRRQGVSAVHFSLGERLRAISDREIASAFTDSMAIHKDTLAHHGVIDDPVLIHGIVEEALAELSEDIAIIDGYPRFERLLNGFHNLVHREAVRVVQLVVIDGSDSFAKERMSTRGRKLFGVGEDAMERLATHREQVAPAIMELEKHYPSMHLDGTKPLSVKTAEVVACVKGSSLL